MSKVIRIGTRDSQLALWQAKKVKKSLEELGYEAQLMPVKSTGDLVLDKPLYELGITGIFTKTLDIAMLAGSIDIAVHSMKDVPTVLPKGIVQTAVLERATSEDIIVFNREFDVDKSCVIATGSLRRKAQWLNKYPNHKVVDLRGNVNTRLKKLSENNWQGAIFAKAGLERINVLPDTYSPLPWMIPAPAQGAMVVVALENDAYSKEATSKLNDLNSYVCTHVERKFLNTLEGGCTAPIGAYAEIHNDTIRFNGVLFSLDGRTKLTVNKTTHRNDFENFGAICAREILDNGGAALMKSIKNEL